MSSINDVTILGGGDPPKITVMSLLYQECLLSKGYYFFYLTTSDILLNSLPHCKMFFFPVKYQIVKRMNAKKQTDPRQTRIVNIKLKFKDEKLL